MANTGPLESGVTNALQTTPMLPQDRATADLARHYARLIDTASPDDELSVAITSDLGPKLLAALTALGMTPTSRNAKGGTSAPVVSDELAKLRERADKRRRSG